jgi:hypothetical protein
MGLPVELILDPRRVGTSKPKSFRSEITVRVEETTSRPRARYRSHLLSSYTKGKGVSQERWETRGTPTSRILRLPVFRYMPQRFLGLTSKNTNHLAGIGILLRAEYPDAPVYYMTCVTQVAPDKLRQKHGAAMGHKGPEFTARK